MRVVVIFLLAFVAVVAARSTAKREKSAPAFLRQLQARRKLTHLLASKTAGTLSETWKRISHPLTASLALSRKMSSALKRTQTEDDDSCADAYIPCVNIDDDDDFFGCVIFVAYTMEWTFYYIYEDITDGGELFTVEEQEHLWDVRFNEDDEYTMKEQLEIEENYVEQAEAKFEAISEADWVAALDENPGLDDTLEEMACQYEGIKNEAYERGDK